VALPSGFRMRKNLRPTGFVSAVSFLRPAMRTLAIFGMAAAALLLGAANAEAARWCHTGANARGCAFATQVQCARTARRVGGACRLQVARRATAQDGMAPGQVYPSRPSWAAPGECFFDEGNGRWRPCNAGGDGGGGIN
jgi:hypothetical protein